MKMAVDTAVTVPVNVCALIDDTDFKTREESVVYNQSGLDLVWNFVTPAGVQTQTAVTPTNTGGSYDWVNVGNGMYNIEIPASGGASINNDTEGYGWFSGFATGILPWVGPIIEFVPANVVNSLVTGSDKLQVNAVEVSGDSTAADNLETAFDDTAGSVPWLGIVDQGTAQSATGTTLVLRAAAAFADDTLIGCTIGVLGSTQGYWQFRQITDNVLSSDTVTVDTWTVTPSGTITYKIFGCAPASATLPPAVNVTQWKGATAPDNTGDAYARLGAPAGASVSADIAAIEAQTDDIGTAGAGLTGIPWNAAWDVEVQSEVADALAVYDPPTNTEMEARTIVAADYATAANLATVDTVVDAIKVKTDQLAFGATNCVDANIKALNDATSVNDAARFPNVT